MTSTHRVHFFHLIWSTKGRKNLILPKMKDRLYEYIGGVIRKSGGALLEIGGIENHIHILIELSNLDSYTALIRNTKAASTSWLKKEFIESSHFAWQDGYSSYSASYSQIDKIREYIKKQEEHHKQHTLENEYRKFLDSCDVKYDAQYIFDEVKLDDKVPLNWCRRFAALDFVCLFRGFLRHPRLSTAVASPQENHFVVVSSFAV